MAIQATPKNGIILMCDFSEHENELISDGNMIKTRPVAVVSPSMQGRGKILHVVPISMTAPKVICPWHVQIPIDCMPAAAQHKGGARWAKCDMVVTAGWSRLNRYEGSKRGGRIEYQDGYLDLPTMLAIKLAIAHTFGIRPQLWEQAAAQKVVAQEVAAVAAGAESQEAERKPPAV